MKIRTRIALQFLIVSSLVLLFASVFIYYFSFTLIKQEFYDRLSLKAHLVARLYNQVSENEIQRNTFDEETKIGSLPEEAIFIFNSQNDLVYQTANKSVFEVEPSLLSKIKSGSHYFQLENGIEIYGFIDSNSAKSLMIIAGAIDNFGIVRLKGLINILLITFLIGNSLAAFAGWFFAGRTLKPLSKVILQVNDISANQLNKRVDLGKNSDEFALVATTFNNLLERVEVAFQTQKQFVASASHELRTPLTIISGQLELALLNTRTPEQYQKILLSLIQDLKNLNQTANRLLLLAQADFQAENLNPKPFRIDEILWQINNEMNTLFPDAIVDIHFEIIPESESDFIILGNEELVKVALSNIVENALKYSKPQYCRITLDLSNFGVVITAEDQGYGIREEDMPKIFIPFYRANSSYTTSGHGLGLAMAKKILQLHSGKIDLKSEINKGTIVSITIPRNSDFLIKNKLLSFN